MNTDGLTSVFNPTGHCLAAEYWLSETGSGWSPTCANKFNRDTCRIAKGVSSPCSDCPNKVHLALSSTMFQDHLSGRKRYGIYPLGQDGLTPWVAADLDNHNGTSDPKADLDRIQEAARSLEIPLQVFSSNSGAGFHVYIFFGKPIPAHKARRLLLTVIERAEVKTTGQGGSFDTVFPKQDHLGPGDLGNLIALPFHGGAMKRGTTLLLNGDNGLRPHGETPDENIDYFIDNLPTIDEAEVDRLLKALGVDQVAESLPDTETTGGQVKGNDRLTWLVEACTFLRHCRDEAATLPEPAWYQMTCLLASQYGGPARIHELSRPHPGYSEKETDEKITHALNDCPGAPTCEAIKRIWDCGQDCRVRTPLGLLWTSRVEWPVEPKNKDPEWPEPMRDQAFHGIAGEFVRLIEPHTEADPVALLLQFLAAFGNVVGRNPFFVAEADWHYPNIFTVMVGETSKGRKGSSFGQVRRVFSALEESWAGRFPGGLSSGEGLIWAVRDPITKREANKEKEGIKDYQDIEIDPGVQDKRLFVVEPEFASVLRVAARDGNTLSAVVRQAWDTGDLQVLTTGRNGSIAKATNAHISIVGHITRDELLRYLDRTEAGNGFANRFLWCCVRRSKCLPEGGKAEEANLNPLIVRLREAIILAPRAEVRRDHEARAIWAEVYPALSEGKPGLFGAVTSRAEAQVMRLALIYALLDQSRVIRKEHLLAGLAVWDYCEASARYIFGDALGDPMSDKIVAAMKNNGGGMTRTQIRDIFQRNADKERIDPKLSDLAGKKIIRKEIIPTGGRPTERWVLI